MCWAPRAERRHSRHRAKAAAAPKVTTRMWHLQRANAARRPLQVRTDGCGDDSVVARCACGDKVVAVRCGLRWLCPGCQRAAAGKLRARVSKAMGARLARARRVQDRRAGFTRVPILVTLTARHSGDMAADRERIGDGWRKLRMWIHNRAEIQTWSREALRQRREEQEERFGAWHPPLAIPDGWVGTGDMVGKFDFALVWECTPGDDGLGHVHAHAVVLWPRFDWARLAAEWKRVMRDPEANIDCGSAAKRGESAVVRATGYLAKYISKGVDSATFEPELAAALVDAMMGKRSVTTSRGFWVPEPCACHRCREKRRIIERPAGRYREPRPVWDTHAIGAVMVTDSWRWADGSARQVEERWTFRGGGRPELVSRRVRDMTLSLVLT